MDQVKFTENGSSEEFMDFKIIILKWLLDHPEAYTAGPEIKDETYAELDQTLKKHYYRGNI